MVQVIIPPDLPQASAASPPPESNTGYLHTAMQAALHASHAVGSTLATTSYDHCNGIVQHIRNLLRGHPQSPLHSPSLLVVNLANIAKQVLVFRKHLPQVDIHYALKSFPDMTVLTMLARLGVSFDCASSFEIDLAKKALTLASLSIPNYNQYILYANTVKSIAGLKHAANQGINRVTVDSIEELHKLREHHPRALAILRIKTDDSTSTIPLSCKFGAELQQIPIICKEAHRLDIKVVGVAFHVGSGAQSARPYLKALKDAHSVFATAQTFGFKMNVLDVGGGFPAFDGEAKITFAEIAQCICREIDRLFGDFVDLHVLAEPGRFICSSAAMAAIRIEQRTLGSNGRTAYTLADGIHGLFRDSFVVGQRFVPRQHVSASECTDGLAGVKDRNLGHEEISDLFGISTDIDDVVARNVRLPRLERGDWLLFDYMGSYTLSLRTARNDVPKSHVEHLFCEGELCRETI